MASNAPRRVFAARLAGAGVFNPIGDKVGIVYDVVILFRLKGDPIAVGLVIEVPGHHRVFLPITRVTSIGGGQVIITGLVNIRRFQQRPGEILVLGQLLERKVTIKEDGRAATVLDAAIENTRGKEWRLTTLYVRTAKSPGHPQETVVLPSAEVSGLMAIPTDRKSVV